MKVRRRQSEAAQEENVFRDHDDSCNESPFNATARTARVPAGAAAAAAAAVGFLLASAVATPRMLCVSVRKVYSKRDAGNINTRRGDASLLTSSAQVGARVAPTAARLERAGTRSAPFHERPPE